MTLQLHATPEDVMRAVEALQAFGQEHGVDERELFRLAVALEESASNIVNHALHRDPRQTFCVSFECKGPTFILELRDGGPPFDPTLGIPRGGEATDSDGGWGLPLVRRYTDEMVYARANCENVLRLSKRLSERSPDDR